MNPGPDQLRSTVFGCEHCTHIPTFSRPPAGGPFYKFPPIIGAQGPAPLLFVGINPRRSHTNDELHDWLMQSSRAFARLSQNRQRNRRPYVAIDGDEEHYRCHAIVVREVFQADVMFASKAAVTELYLCASETGAELLGEGRSQCAERYLANVINILMPTVVVEVGWKVHEHLSEHFSDVIQCPRVLMEHPKYLAGLRNPQKKERLQPTIDRLRELLGR